MTPLRYSFVIVASMVGSAVTLAAVVIVATALAAITGVTMSAPGLVTATPGRGTELATASTGGATVVWFVAVTLALVGAEVLVQRQRRARRGHRSRRQRRSRVEPDRPS